MDNPIERLHQEVRGLHERNARHKRGFRLREVPPVTSLLHAIEECSEAARAVTAAEPSRAVVVGETGDALACLVHFMVAQGLTLDEVAESALAKLPSDFPAPAEDPVEYSPPPGIDSIKPYDSDDDDDGEPAEAPPKPEAPAAPAKPAPAPSAGCPTCQAGLIPASANDDGVVGHRLRRGFVPCAGR